MGVLPDFLVIGAQKAGTTFLYQSLLQHPLVFGAYQREVAYLGNYNRALGGVEGYRKHFPPREELSAGAVVGEKSPGYMSSPCGAENAYRIVPGAKIVVLLRNPVDRTYSNYHHVAMKVGKDPLSFDEAIKVDSQRAKEDRRFGYLKRSQYVDHLPRWYEKFGPKILVVQSEEMYEHPRRILRQVCEFIGVDWDRNYFTLHSRGGKRANRNSGAYREPMKSETRERLEEYFKPYNQKLYEYLGRDFGW